MSVTWVIHSVVDPTRIHEMDRTGSQLKEAVEQTDEGSVDLFLPPFSTDLPEPPDGPFVLYGGTRLVEAAAISSTWQNSVWYDAERFRWSNNQAQWGDLTLMQDFYVTTFGEQDRTFRESNQLLFVRPDADLKEFSGRLMPAFHLAQWADRIADLGDSGATMTADTKIVVGKPLTIEREWRVFVVDSRPVECSRYMTYEILDLVREFPEEVRELADRVCATHLPAPVVVIDIGYAAGRYGVIEANCFNGSGWYAVNLPTIVNEVSHYVRRNHAN